MKIAEKQCDTCEHSFQAGDKCLCSFSGGFESPENCNKFAKKKNYICPACKYYDWDCDDMGGHFGCWCENGFNNLKGFPFEHCKAFESRYNIN